jgi:alpha-glucosidase
MRRILTLFLVNIITLILHGQAATTFILQSPDKKIQVQITAGARLQYRIAYQEKTLLDSCHLALHLQNNLILGQKVQVNKTTRRSVQDTIIPIVKEKRSRIPDVYNELTIQCKGNYHVIFRAYNDGVAYRFATQMKDSITVLNEDAIFNFNQAQTIYYTPVNKRIDADIFHTSFESPYTQARLDTMSKEAMIFTPTLLYENNAPKVVITESDLLDYPGMFLQKQDGQAIKGVFAPYPKNIMVTEGEFPQQIVTEREK